LEDANTHHALNSIQHAPRMQHANRVSSYQATKRVADDAELGNLAALALNELQLLLDLGTHAFAAALDAIVGVIARVGLGAQKP
jgi:hypothetical protein